MFDRSPDDPDGNIVMSIAENRLTVDMFRDRLQSASSFPDSAFFYDNMTGSTRLKQALIRMLQQTYIQVKHVDQIVRAIFGALVGQHCCCISAVLLACCCASLQACQA